MLTHTFTHAVSRTRVDVSAIQQLSLSFTSDSARYIVRLALPQRYREIERVIVAQRVLEVHLEWRLAYASCRRTILVPDPACSWPNKVATTELLARTFIVIAVTRVYS